MPKVSKDSATGGGDFGPVVDRSEGIESPARVAQPGERRGVRRGELRGSVLASATPSVDGEVARALGGRARIEPTALGIR